LYEKAEFPVDGYGENFHYQPDPNDVEDEALPNSEEN